mmetsp:Transcript_10740/g.21564  ORF Transcript_10740/g.21564 Transcript_10740/m.21564 type:complete len:95 (-) Transcript_10740:378-662(-)
MIIVEELRDDVRQGNIEVEWRAGNEQVEDCLTKPEEQLKLSIEACGESKLFSRSSRLQVSETVTHKENLFSFNIIPGSGKGEQESDGERAQVKC